MSEIKDNPFFDDSFNSNRQIFEERDVSVERLNELFHNGGISSQEHSFLLRKLYPVEKRISAFAWLCLSCAVVSWISFLKFSFGETEFTLMSGENKMLVVSVLAPLAIIFFCLAYREVRKKHNVKGLEIALIGVSVATAQLTIVAPVWLMQLYLNLFY